MKKVITRNVVVIVAFFLGISVCCSQHTNILTATLDGETKEIRIQQELEYVNSSDDILETVYFNDWAHAYSDKNTGLAERFAQEFKKVFTWPKTMNVVIQKS
ncbi:hypothetical protein [Maribacter halichondriae]|uniref:hypothetical protein n=1 Tax=Maribacter halichondriae TaxID=2980554 RepID=UPI0030766F11